MTLADYIKLIQLPFTFEHVLEMSKLSGAQNLTLRHICIIHYLKGASDENARTVRVVAEKLKFSRPVITRAITTLAEIGIVVRRKDTLDRRNLFLDLTA